MNLVLLRKEVAGIRACMMLVLVLELIDVVYTCWSGFPDKPDTSENGPEGAIMQALLFGMLIGLSVFGQEREHGTLTFLDGLPVNRLGLFLHKSLAAFIAIGVSLVVPLLFDLVFDWIARTSISEPVSWNAKFSLLVLGAVASFTVVSVTMLLSYAKQWFPLVAGVSLWAFVWFRSSGSIYAAWLDTSTLVKPVMDQGAIILPWRQIVGHSLLGIGAWVAACCAFMNRDSAVSIWVGKISAWRFSGCLTGIARILAIIAWYGAMFHIAKDDHRERLSPEATAAGVSQNSLEPTGSQNSPVGFAKIDTKHYEVLFRESQREVANVLQFYIDPAHDHVSKFFQNPREPGAKIVVDIAGDVVSHAAGQTNWTKIRVPLALASSYDDFYKTLRHETAHVYIEQLSEGRALNHFNAMRAFHEGVATAAELVEDETSQTERQKIERWAAGTDSRGRVKLELLLNDAKLSQERDPFVVYPLGYVFALAMIDVGGPSMPRRVMEALRDSKLSNSTSPSELWRSLLFKCGTSFDHVISAYETRLDALALQEKTFVDQFPRLEAKVTLQGDLILIQIDPSKLENVDGNLVCKVEVDRFLTKLPEYVPMRKQGEFQIPRSEHPGASIRYLLGWVANETHVEILEPWAEAKLGNVR